MIQRSLLRQTRILGPKSVSSAARAHIPPIRILPLQSRASASRQYSTAAESASSTSNSEPPPPNPQAAQESAQTEDPSKTELETKNREIIDLKDRYLRSVADFRNLQDRTKRDIDNARNYAITNFARDLIESVDNLDRAISTADASASASSAEGAPSSGSENEGNKAFSNLYQGLKMTESILMQTLKKHGLERFDPGPGGEKFDPSLHDAAFQAKIEGKEDGTCFDTIQKGFKLNNRVVRAAKVGVVKNS